VKRLSIQTDSVNEKCLLGDSSKGETGRQERKKREVVNPGGWGFDHTWGGKETQGVDGS